MSWWQHGAASTSGASQPTARASASSVAVSQACSASTTSGAGSSTASAMPPTTKSAAMPSPVATAVLWSARLLAHVDAGHHDRQPAHVGEVPLGRERQVAVAAAEVGHPQRLVLGRPAQVALLDRLGDRRVQDAQELLDLAVLPLPARLHPALVVGQAEGHEHRVVLGQQPALVAVVVPLRPRPPRRGRCCAAARRPSWSRGPGGTAWWCRRASCRTARRAGRRRRRGPRRRARGWRCAPGVSSYAVTWRRRPALRST